jgi:peptidoglycan-associated lipoprotein
VSRNLPREELEDAMKWAIVIVAAVGLSAFGCKKGRRDVNNQGDADSESNRPDDRGDNMSKAPAPKSVETAVGDMKDLLLALRRVHFGFDTDKLTDAGKQALTEAAEKLEAMPKVALYVDGHTDDRGTTEYNMSLSERRAQTVVKYLQNLGIEADRLNIVSFGEETPMSSGESDVDHAKNRRVEFRIMRGDIQFVLEEGELVDDNGRPMTALNNAGVE